MPSDGVLISIIGAVGGVLAAYITVSYRRRKPTEYVDTAFDTLNNIIRRQDEEIKRLTAELERVNRNREENT